MDKVNILAIDIGTTSTKAVIFDAKGKLISKASVGYEMYSPKPSWSEQDPEEIFNAVINSFKEAIQKANINANDLVGVTFSSAMHSLIGMDENGFNLTQCITWADNRSYNYTEKLKTEWDGNSIYRRTGTPLHPMAPLSKILWFKYEDKETYNRVSKWISIKEFIFFKLFGEYVVDYSIASATGLFNIYQLEWDKEALEILGITIDHLSKPVPTTFQISNMKNEWKEVLGLTDSIPFIVGASDGVLANLGVGAIKHGITAITVGTSGAVRKVVNKPVTDGKGRIFCYALTEDLWVIGGATNNGGLVFQWIRDEIASIEVERANKDGIEPYEYLTNIASNVDAGSNGLIFMPFLTGERAPYWNSNARGVFFGLSRNHQKKHMIRAALEGVVYQLYNVYKILDDLTSQSTEVRANGGFARSALWSQIMADVFSINVKIPVVYESSAFGAAKLGFYSLGIIASLEELSIDEAMNEFVPNAKNNEIYEELFDIYQNVYNQIHPQFDRIVKFQ